MTAKMFLWEILVPATENTGKEIEISYHHAWDEKVRALSGGLTILRRVTGQWMNADQKTYIEKMIPVRIACDEKTIEKISGITTEHYRQEAVMYYAISRRIFIKHYTQ